MNWGCCHMPWLTEFASVLRGLVQSDWLIYSTSCVAVGKYMPYTQHRCALGSLVALPPVQSVKASLMQNLHIFRPV